MNHVVLDVKCEDFLKDNRHLYVRKAKRKKIALISVELANTHSGDVRLLLGAATLIAGERRYNVERRAIIIRKLSEFKWDFLRGEDLLTATHASADDPGAKPGWASFPFRTSHLPLR